MSTFVCLMLAGWLCMHASASSSQTTKLTACAAVNGEDSDNGERSINLANVKVEGSDKTMSSVLRTGDMFKMATGSVCPDDDCSDITLLMCGRHRIAKETPVVLGVDSVGVHAVSSLERHVHASKCPKDSAVCGLKCSPSCLHMTLLCCKPQDVGNNFLVESEQRYQSGWYGPGTNCTNTNACYRKCKNDEYMTGIECGVQATAGKNCGTQRIQCARFGYAADNANKKSVPMYNGRPMAVLGYWARKCSHKRGGKCTFTKTYGIESSSSQTWGQDVKETVASAREHGIETSTETKINFGFAASLEVRGKLSGKVSIPLLAEASIEVEAALKVSGHFDKTDTDKTSVSHLVKNSKTYEFTRSMSKFTGQKTATTEVCEADPGTVDDCDNVAIYQWHMRVGNVTVSLCDYYATCGYTPLCFPGCCKGRNCQTCSDAPGCDVKLNANDEAATLQCHVNFHDGSYGHALGNVTAYTESGCTSCIYSRNETTMMCMKQAALACGKSVGKKKIADTGECNDEFGSELCCCDDTDGCNGVKERDAPKDDAIAAGKAAGVVLLLTVSCFVANMYGGY